MRRERRRGVDVRVSVDGAEPEKLRALETGNHAEDALLLGVAEPRLESDQIPHPPVPIFHAQLNDGMTARAHPRVDETDRLHRAKTKGVPAAARHLLDGHAPLEV